MTDQKRPLVTAACLCEKVLTEKDGALTLVRVIDRFILEAPPDVVERLNPHLVLTLVVMLKANGNVGKHQLSLQLHGPTQSQEPQSFDVEFLPANEPLAGTNLIANIAVGVVKNFGQMKFDILFDGEYLTSVPFTVLRAQEQTSAEPGQSKSS